MESRKVVYRGSYSFLFLISLVLCIGCSLAENRAGRQKTAPKPIAVGVFNGNGGAQSCLWETVAAIRLDPDMSVRMITTADIANNVLDSLDAILIPGGGGKRQFQNLGAENRRRIQDFVAKGGGAVGICAGAYLFSHTPGYACMGMNGQQAIDIEHDNRGHGLAKFTLNEEGKRLFPELADRDTCYVIYYEGPVFIQNPSDTIRSTTLAVMESDVHEEGNAPADMTNGKPFFVASQYGRGRVFSSIAHPEGTPGMMWMIPRMVRYTLDKPLISYQQAAVQPGLYDRELLMTPADLAEEAGYFDVLLQGASDRKIAALDWLEAHHSWDAKRWVQGLLYDDSPAVRIRAARYIADTHYLPYLYDLNIAWLSETDQNTKTEIKAQLDKLHALLPLENRATE